MVLIYRMLKPAVAGQYLGSDPRSGSAGHGVKATIEEERVKELAEIADDFLSKTMLAVKALRSYVSKAGNFASLLFSWRPFLGKLWAAVSDPSIAAGAPPNCIGSKQVRQTLLWIWAFLRRERGSIVRIFTLQSHRSGGQKILMCTVACPWGVGVASFLDGVAVEYFMVELSKHDFDLFEHAMGDPAGQQTSEAFAILIALRHRSSHWRRCRAKLEVRADNVSALTMLTCFRVSGRGLTMIAREIALDVGCGTYRPAICAHSLRVAHKLADTLSRKYALGFKYYLPQCLPKARETLIPARTEEYDAALEL